MTGTTVGSCACGARWSGTRTAHCGGCHETFGGVSLFDQHRRTGANACRTPLELALEWRRGAWRGPEFDVGGLRGAR